VTWLDDHRFAYVTIDAAHIVDASSGRELQSIPGANLGYQAILAPDGKTIYDTYDLISHVTRHLIENFGDRPRP
jgi:hypothetical protein